MTGELARFLPQLTDALGGETQEAPAPGSSATADTPPWEN